MPSCNRCNRPLSDPVSIERGFGPTCWDKINAKNKGQAETIKCPPKSNWPKKDVKMPEEGKKRIYHFLRNLAGDAMVVAELPNGKKYDVNHICHHSPTGMEFFYAGSGPADCARSVLADCVGLPLADLLYQDFKFAFISGIDQKNGRCLREYEIRVWVKNHLDLALVRCQPTDEEIDKDEI